MAFRSNLIGPTYVAWSDENTLYVEYPTGIQQFAVPFGIRLPKQKWDFYSEHVVFYLEGNDICFAGRLDGTFSGIRKRDNVLVRFGKWEPPADEKFTTVGTYKEYHTSPMLPAMLNRDDRRTITIAGANKVYVFNEPYMPLIGMHTSVRDGLIGELGLRLYDKAEEVSTDANGSWFVPSLKGRTSNRVFV